MVSDLDFERPIAELEGKAVELRALAQGEDGVNLSKEADLLEKKAKQALADIYKNLTPWRKCKVARHAMRPQALNYIQSLFDEYTPLSGDRNYAEDHAIVGGLARFQGRPVVVIGHERGHDMQSRIHHNFGMARPEGYRKAARLMALADRFSLPMIALVDTTGAYPGVGAEERGQSEAIARSTEMCLRMKTPLISVILGEGGSGGAVAMATSDRLLMLEHSIYSVISPEGCASILWKDSAKMREAAEALHLTAQDMLKLGITDEIISEPVGGAHRHPETVIKNVGQAIVKHLAELSAMTPDALVAARRERFINMGQKRL